MKKLILPLVMGTLIFSSCENKKTDAVAFDLDAAKKEIAAQNAAFESAIAKGDSVAFGAIFTEDAKRFNPNAPAIVGKPTIMSNFSSVIKLNIIGSVKLTMDGVYGDENYVTEEGTFTIFAKDGSVMDKGKYLDLFKKEDGQYKMYRESWNSDLPAAPAAK